MAPLIARGASLVLLLLAAVSDVDSKRPFGSSAQVGKKQAKKQVKVSFDDETFSFWDPFKNTGFNVSAAVAPIAEEVGRRGPGYLAYAAVTTGLGLFLPPKVLTAVNVAYVAAAVARSHESDVETFCRDEGRLLLGMPSLHLAAAGSALRALRFRLWRRLFVRATLFRLRYQLRFMRIYRPKWVSKGASPLALIVQDTAHAARSVQGLLPDLCRQASVFAGGCRLPYWSECKPPPRIERGWRALRPLDRRLKREFGKRVTRVRSRDSRPPGPGLPLWRLTHRFALGTAGAFLKSPGGRGGGSSSCRPREKHFVLRRSRKVRGGGGKKGASSSSAAQQLLDVIEAPHNPDDNVVAEELLEEYAAVLYGGMGEDRVVGGQTVDEQNVGQKTTAAAGKRAGKKEEKKRAAEERGVEKRRRSDAAQEKKRGGVGLPRAEEDEETLPAAKKVPRAISKKGPSLVRFHNVTTIASRGSTLTKSYRALVELPYGDGHSSEPKNEFLSSLPKSVPAWAATDPDDRGDSPSLPRTTTATTPPTPPLDRQPPKLQPVVIKRTIRRQIRLAEDDIASARKLLRRLVYRAELDLDLSGVLAEVAASVARTADLRSEADSIEKLRSNLARAGMLGSAVGVPEVVSCPEVGPLAREGILVTTALRGVDVSDTYVMQHAAASGEKERRRFVDVVFKAFAQMCLADGCFPSNPMPENLLYMYSGQVGLTDLSSVSELTEAQRRGLCRLYRALAELKGVDASNPSEAAEQKAKAAMEGIGLVIDLPPAGGIVWSSKPLPSWTAEEVGALAVAKAAERAIDATIGTGSDDDGDGDGDGDEEEGDGKEGGEEGEQKREQKKIKEEAAAEAAEAAAAAAAAAVEAAAMPASPPTPRAPLTYVMLLRGLFDTQREEALALMGGGGGDLLRGMAVRRLPQAVAPVLRMVANLRGVCAHLDVDKSVLPRFSSAASKGLSWRHSSWV